MSGNELLQCEICCNDLNLEDRKPRILECCGGNKVCEACLVMILKSNEAVRNCPLCATPLKDTNIKSYVVHPVLMRDIRDQNKNI